MVYAYFGIYYKYKQGQADFLKKLLSIALMSFIIMQVFIFPISLTASAETFSGSCGTNVTWAYDLNGTLTITGTGAMYDYSSTPVPWSSYRSSISKIIISSGVTSIGNYAFSGFSSLVSISLSDNINSIGEYAFSWCTSLNSIIIPSGVTSIGYNAFGNCTSLTSVSISSGVISLGNNLFFSCWSLKSVTIPSSVTYLGSNLFDYCSSLENIFVSEDNLNYSSDNGILYNKDKSELILCPIKKNGDYVIPSNVVKIDDAAFQYTSFTSIVIPSSVTSIGSNAFVGCRYLTNITIPSGVTSIGIKAFNQCSSIQNITVSENNLYYSSTDNVLFNKDKTELIYAVNTINGSYTIPNSVSIISGYAFSSCKLLTNILIPDSITTIGDNAFEGCSLLTTITIPSSVTSIGKEAFSFCTSLKNVTIPSSVTSISDYEFNKCTSLTNVNIPESVITIGNNAFSNCSLLASVNIPVSVTSILYGAFYSCTSLKSINIPASVISIGNDVFFECTNLTINCYSGSFAETYAIKNGVNVITKTCLHSNSTYIETKAATCTEAGSETRTCSECGDIDTREIPTTGHKWNDWTEITTPTCTAVGSKTRTCSVCNVTDTSEIAAKGHNYIATVTNQTCTEKGYTTHTCSVCGNSYVDSYVEATGHTYVVTVTNPTCTEKGYTTHTCSACGDSYIDSYVNVLGHSFGDWVVTKAPTYTEKGIETRTCTVCGAKETLEIDMKELPSVSVSYRTHVQDFGWQDYVTDGNVSGTQGQSKRLEGINIDISNNSNLGIEYTTHVQDIGWQGFVSNGEMSGTQGQSKRLEAIKVKLTGEDADQYDIYYRVHAENYGWLGWAKNGNAAGTEGLSLRLEAIQIIVVKKTDIVSFDISNSFISAFGNGSINYRTHVQDYGWQNYVSDGAMSGTQGQSLRLEGINIKLSTNLPSGSILYSTHVQDIGWMNEVCDGALSGTQGQSKRLEAITIHLTGEVANQYDIYYRVHAQNVGWMGWAKNGEKAGTAGYAYRLEGIEIVLAAKGGAAPGSTQNAFMNKMPISVPMILQNPELPTGCEVTSLTMMLNYLGYYVDKCYIADNFLPKTSSLANPNNYFIGDPHQISGFGCFARVITKTANDYLASVGSSYKAIDISNSTPSQLYSYIQSGIPVIVWATMNMQDTYVSRTWTATDTGEEINWHIHEHCLVLVGYDPINGIVTMNDPLVGIVTYSATTFETRYAQMGSQTVVIMKSVVNQ